MGTFVVFELAICALAMLVFRYFYTLFYLRELAVLLRSGDMLLFTLGP
jgi:hypothetical protein